MSLLIGIMIPSASPVSASCSIKLWSPGKPRQVGLVEVTGLPGKDYYRQVGEWTYWHRNGQIQKKGTFTEGTETGWWKYWYKDGIRRREGAYDDKGNKDGPWKYWYENGLEAKEGSYKGGLPDGHWKFYYNQPKNSLKEKGDFIEGREDGPWVYRYKNGLNKKEGSYINGLEDGPWKYWYEDGEIKSEGSYSKGVEVGEWTYRDRTGAGEDRKVEEWGYFYTEVSPSDKPRKIESLSQALVGHWLTEKTLANFQRSQLEPRDPHHMYMSNQGRFLEVVTGGFIESTYTIEKEDPKKRTIQFRLTRSDGKGAVIFAIFSADYLKLAGMYYLVDFLHGSRGKTTNYLFTQYAGTDPGPELK